MAKRRKKQPKNDGLTTREPERGAVEAAAIIEEPTPMPPADDVSDEQIDDVSDEQIDHDSMREGLDEEIGDVDVEDELQRDEADDGDFGQAANLTPPPVEPPEPSDDSDIPDREDDAGSDVEPGQGGDEDQAEEEASEHRRENPELNPPLAEGEVDERLMPDGTEDVEPQPMPDGPDDVGFTWVGESKPDPEVLAEVMKPSFTLTGDNTSNLDDTPIETITVDIEAMRQEMDDLRVAHNALQGEKALLVEQYEACVKQRDGWKDVVDALEARQAEQLAEARGLIDAGQAELLRVEITNGELQNKLAAAEETVRERDATIAGMKAGTLWQVDVPLPGSKRKRVVTVAQTMEEAVEKVKKACNVETVLGVMGNLGVSFVS